MNKKAVKVGVMLDCSRGAVYSVETLKKYIDVLKKMGFSSLQLYTEDTYEVEGEPFFGYLRGRYSKEELKELVKYAEAKKITIIPCIQTLAHLVGALRWPAYFDCTDIGDILLAGEERVYTLIENMFRTCAECFTCREINIGMDEAHLVGLGKYLDKHGYCNRFSILSKHLHRVCEIAAKYGFRPMIWSDMFFRLANHGKYEPSDQPLTVEGLDIPENLRLIYWDYYSMKTEHYDSMLKSHEQLGREVVFAGGAWTWSGFIPYNRFSIEATKAALKACRENGVKEAFFTSWKDDGSESSIWSNLPALWYAAEYARGNYEEEAIAAGFKKLFGMTLDEFLHIEDAERDGDSTEIRNPSKYMLYSDPFLGIFDRTVSKENADLYAKTYEQLLPLCKGKFGYMFKTIANLCHLQEKRCLLGVNARTAYRSGDKEQIGRVIEDFRETEKRLRVFASSFEAQWEKECKPFGYERHDIRLGGALRRLEHCRRRLEQFAAGKLKSIPELDEDILLLSDKDEDGKTILYNDWIYGSIIKPFG